MSNALVAHTPLSFFAFFKKSISLSFYAFSKNLPLCLMGAIISTCSNLSFRSSMTEYLKSEMIDKGFTAATAIIHLIQNNPTVCVGFVFVWMAGTFFNMVFITHLNAKFHHQNLYIKQSLKIAQERVFPYFTAALITLLISMFPSLIWNPSMSFWIFMAVLPLQFFFSIMMLFTQYFILLENKNIFDAFHATWNLVSAKYFFRIILILIVIGQINTFVYNMKPWFANYPDASYPIAILMFFTLMVPFQTVFLLNLYYDLKCRKLQKT